MLAYADEIKQDVTYIQEFEGYNHNLRSKASQFYDITNMTGDDYPVITTRGQRSDVLTYSSVPNGIFAKEGLLWVSGENLYYTSTTPTGQETPVGTVENSKKQFASIGAYVMILPDKKIFNTKTGTLKEIDFRYTWNVFPSYSPYGAFKVQLQFTPCLVDGTPVTYTESPTAPVDTSVYWLDSNTKEVKVYNTNAQVWQAIDNVFLKVSPALVPDDPLSELPPTPEAVAYHDLLEDLFDSLSVYDTIRFGQVIGGDASYGRLNGANVIYGKGETGDGYIVIAGLQPTEFVTSRFAISRTCPDFDYICSLNNRIWGCSSANREIYACKLGDPTQWENFAGLSSDSYSATIGSDGKFTGAVAYNNAVYFFKKDRMHKVYGDYPSNFSVTEITVNGVQEGSEDSLVVVNGLLFYKGVDDVMVFDGSLPVSCSDNFGNAKYSNAVAGKQMNKYYISMKDASNKWHLFVYDTTTGFWHKEDDTHFLAATTHENELYYAAPHTVDNTTTYTMTKAVGSGENSIDWSIESGNLGLDSMFHKYISKVTIRLAVTGTLKVYILYDNGEFTEIYNKSNLSLNSFSIPINVKRCDHFRLKLSGTGKVTVYSIGYFTETGSEI